jgi:hypothetical protein
MYTATAVTRQVLCAATPGLLELDDVIATHFGSSLRKSHRLAKQRIVYHNQLRLLWLLL